MRIQPQPLTLLIVLATSAGETVSREELHASLWAGTHVEFDAALNGIQRFEGARHPQVREDVAQSVAS